MFFTLNGTIYLIKDKEWKAFFKERARKDKIERNKIDLKEKVKKLTRVYK